MARGCWVYVGGRVGNKPTKAEKTAITAACEKFIAEALAQRFLAEICPTEFNDPIAVNSNGNKYRFVIREPVRNPVCGA